MSASGHVASAPTRQAIGKYGRADLEELHGKLVARIGYSETLARLSLREPDGVTDGQVRAVGLWRFVDELDKDEALSAYPFRETSIAAEVASLSKDRGKHLELTERDYAWLAHAKSHLARQPTVLVRGASSFAITDAPGNVRYVTLELQLCLGSGQILLDPVSALLDGSGHAFRDAIDAAFEFVAWMNGGFLMSGLDVVWRVSSDHSVFEEKYDGPSVGACCAMLLDELVNQRVVRRSRGSLSRPRPIKKPKFLDARNRLVLGQVDPNRRRLSSTGEIVTKLEPNRLKQHDLRRLVVFSNEDEERARATLKSVQVEVECVQHDARQRPLRSPETREPWRWVATAAGGAVCIAVGIVIVVVVSDELAPVDVRFPQSEYEISPGDSLTLAPTYSRVDGLEIVRWRVHLPKSTYCPEGTEVAVFPHGETAGMVRVPARCSVLEPLLVELKYVIRGEPGTTSVSLRPIRP